MLGVRGLYTVGKVVSKRNSVTGSEQRVVGSLLCRGYTSRSAAKPDIDSGGFTRGDAVSFWERPLLALSTAVQAFLDPTAQDKLAHFAELTSGPSLAAIRSSMLLSKTGRSILRHKPLISSSTLSASYLSSLPPKSFGYRYYNDYLQHFGLDMDTRAPIAYLEDEELAYVMLRWRQIHDFLHVLTGVPPSLEGEVALKVFEAVATGKAGGVMPHTVISAMVGQFRLLWALGPGGALDGNSGKLLDNATQGIQGIQRLWNEHIPWALQCASSCKSLMNVDYEQLLEWELDRVRDELGIWISPFSHPNLK